MAKKTARGVANRLAARAGKKDKKGQRPLAVLMYFYEKLGKLIKKRQGRAPKEGEKPLALLLKNHQKLGKIIAKRGGVAAAA